jgi:hypothetical protein
VETAVRAQWLLEPDDPFERERRWMTTLRELERALDNIARDCKQVGMDASTYEALGGETKRFADRVEAALRLRMPNYSPLRGLPSIESLLDAFGRRDLYVFYRAGSQYIHGTQLATDLYKRRSGHTLQLGEFISGSQWRECLGMSWWGLYESGRRWLSRMDVDPTVPWPANFVAEVDQALRHVESAVNVAVHYGRQLIADTGLTPPSAMKWRWEYM